MTQQIPSWASSYVGIPFDIGGRSKIVGLDCWGLVCVVYAEQYEIELPKYEGIYNDDDFNREQRTRIETYVVQEKQQLQKSGTFQEVPLESALEGDLLITRTIGQPWHLGIVLHRGVMLNTRENVNCVVESYQHPLWVSKIAGLYRHETRV